MGLLDFVKDAGDRIFNRDREEELARLNTERGGALSSVVKGLDLSVDGLGINVDGSTATVTGTVPSQEVREKVVLVVGNTAGIGQVDDRLAVFAGPELPDTPPEPQAVMYTVARGDTLSGIAKQHYGSAGKYMTIFKANIPMLKDPDKIYPGQVLRIPPQG